MGDKLHRLKGNSPDPPLRSQSPAQWKRMWERADNQDVGLEAATIERVRNSLLVECAPAPTIQRGYAGYRSAGPAPSKERVVGERSIASEVVRERTVETTEVRMPV
jgi:hypothetical protein